MTVSNNRRQRLTVVLLATYGTLLVVTVSAIALTLYRYPLFPLDTTSLEWTAACCVLGSPFCCLYVLSKVVIQNKSLRLDPCTTTRSSGNETYDPLNND